MNWPPLLKDFAATSAPRVVKGGTVLCPDGTMRRADVAISHGLIVELSDKINATGCWLVDASDCLVLPGIVDIHGDAFERNIMPRPGTLFPLDMAMPETDRQLVANGITTAFHGVSISWEPGLRNLSEARRIVATLDRLEQDLSCDNRIHIRWETFALDEAPGVIELLQGETKPVLAFNDHTSPIFMGGRLSAKIRTAAARAMIDEADYARLLDERKEREDEVQQAIEVVAAVARASGVAMLSHDDTSVATRKCYRDLGVRIAEFPVTWEVAEEASTENEAIVLGAPNVVRGGSHTGAISAVDAIARGYCSILASDYYYPAPLHAAFQLVASGALSLAQAWNLISLAPAKALGLLDRGLIAPGYRADMVVVPRKSPRVRATLVTGKTVYQSA
jgi:alpha-D-ribose 1-methylphosphonate 5-triphosphate diphosphatase